MSSADQQAASAPAASSSVESTTPPPPQESNSEKNAADDMSPILEKFTLVTLQDGRQVYGTLIAFDSNANLLLNETVERRAVPSTADSSKTYITQRQQMTMAIPVKHVTGFYQRDTRPPEIEALIEQETAKLRALEEAAKAGEGSA